MYVNMRLNHLLNLLSKINKMKDAILETMSVNDAFTYQDEPIEMAKERLEYYHEELSTLYNSELIQDPEQLYCLGDVLNIINTIKENL